MPPASRAYSSAPAVGDACRGAGCASRDAPTGPRSGPPPSSSRSSGYIVFGLSETAPSVMLLDPLDQLVAVGGAVSELRDQVQHEQREHVAPPRSAGGLRRPQRQVGAEHVGGPARGRELGRLGGSLGLGRCLARGPAACGRAPDRAQLALASRRSLSPAAAPCPIVRAWLARNKPLVEHGSRAGMRGGSTLEIARNEEHGRATRRRSFAFEAAIVGDRLRSSRAALVTVAPRLGSAAASRRRARRRPPEQACCTDPSYRQIDSTRAARDAAAAGARPAGPCAARSTSSRRRRARSRAATPASVCAQVLWQRRWLVEVRRGSGTVPPPAS